MHNAYFHIAGSSRSAALLLLLSLLFYFIFGRAYYIHSAHIKSVGFYIVAICEIVKLHTLLHAQFVGTFVIYYRSRSSCIASTVDQLLT